MMHIHGSFEISLQMPALMGVERTTYESPLRINREGCGLPIPNARNQSIMADEDRRHRDPRKPGGDIDDAAVVTNVVGH